MTSTRRQQAQAEPNNAGRPRTVTAPLAATAVAYGVLMLAYHVQADAEYLAKNAGESNEAPFFQRVQDGPFGFSTLDKVLFGAFVLMAFELLQFAVHGSGSEAIQRV